jgi:ABC-2 type transport system permease protein
MLKSFFIDIKEWIIETARIFRHEFSAVFTDTGVLIFFFFLPLAYPIVYSLIYNTEVSRDMPVAVVDNSRTALSREFIRHADATQAIKICGYAANMQEAKQWMAERKCYAIFEIPADYAEKIGRAQQPQVQFYIEMSLLLRYRTFTSSIAELQMATCAELREMSLADLGIPSSGSSSAIESYGFAMGDTQQGFASFVIPGIVVLILQQSMILGIMMLGGTRNENRRRLLNGGNAALLNGELGNAKAKAKAAKINYDLSFSNLSPSANIFGRALCYTLIFLPLTIYILHFVPHFFSYPQEGNLLEELMFIFPMLLATAMLGQTLIIFASERESAFIVIVFTSVAFLFLSGLTWPRFAMSQPLLWLSDLIPATWGIQGFIHMNSNGAPLAFQSTAYYWLWGLTAFYTLTAYLVARRQHGRR